jgi:hypothetical protein
VSGLGEPLMEWPLRWPSWALFFCPDRAFLHYFQDSQSVCSTASVKGDIAVMEHNLGLNLNSFLGETNIWFQRVWELSSEFNEVKAYGSNDESVHQSRRGKIAKYVAATAEVSQLQSIVSSTVLKIAFRLICAQNAYDKRVKYVLRLLSIYTFLNKTKYTCQLLLLLGSRATKQLYFDLFWSKAASL